MQQSAAKEDVRMMMRKFELKSKATRNALFALIWLSLLTLGLVYAVNTNLPNAGMVMQSTPYPLSAIPTELRPYLNFGEPVLLILHRPYPLGLTIPQSVQTVAGITTKVFPSGTVVELVNPSLDWTVDYRQFQFPTQFERLLISDNARVVSPLESGIALTLLSPVGFLVWGLAVFGFYAGPLLFVLKSYLLDKRPTFFSFACTASGYALTTLLTVIFALIHHNYLPYFLIYFGYSLPILILLSLLVLRFERTPYGKHQRRILWGLKQED